MIEIGPGLGALTESIVKMNVPTTLFELDREFSAYWSRVAKENPHIKLIEGDALDADCAAAAPEPGTLLVSNLPYQIGARIVIEMSQGPANIDRMVLMFQKEVGQRLAAQPKTKEYGLLTVVAQAAWKIQTVSEAGPGDFYPPPRIASRVLSFERKNTVVTAHFVEFVKRAFSQRRKFMLKSFAAEREKLTQAVIDLGYSDKVRAEEITVEHFMQLAETIKTI
jgi:16S rRNA (adenine1518-N6/adenine1519-N6)-dimethyltransferase